MAIEYPEQTDEALLELCRMDDPAAYNELFARYSPKLYAVCKQHLKDDFLAEEMAMDILFWLWKNRQEITIHEDLSAYLYRAARNAIISYRRKKNKELIVLRQTHPEDGAVDSRMADYYVRSEEEENRYQQLLDRLSPQRRSVFVLSREYGLTYAEIAKKTNLSVNTVENYIASALKHFRKGIVSIAVVIAAFLSL